MFKRYGLERVRGAYEVDHLIALELGGPNAIENLWPQSYTTEPWNARVKNRMANVLHRMVCAGELDIEVVQIEVANDWIGAYQRYMAPGSAWSGPVAGGASGATEDARGHPGASWRP